MHSKNSPHEYDIQSTMFLVGVFQLDLLRTIGVTQIFFEFRPIKKNVGLLSVGSSPKRVLPPFAGEWSAKGPVIGLITNNWQWGNWAGSEIVKEPHLGRRVLLLIHFITIAQVSHICDHVDINSIFFLVLFCFVLFG